MRVYTDLDVDADLHVAPWCPERRGDGRCARLGAG